MPLINNELIYDQEDTPKDFDLLDWKYLVPVLKAVSAKITDVEQRGIYGNEPRRFALVTSEALTEQEIADVLTTWDNFDATPLKAKEKRIATETLRQKLGKEVGVYMSYLCEDASLTIDAYTEMLNDPTLMMIDRLLDKGALQTCRDILSAYVVTLYFPDSFKQALLGKLDECISQVNAFIA